MPFYDLKCEQCGLIFEISATMEERSQNRIPCPDCGGTLLTRVFDTSNIGVLNRTESTAHDGYCCHCANRKNCRRGKE